MRDERPPASATTIVLVHAHTLVLQGLRHHMDHVPEFAVVGEATNGQQAIQVIGETEPDMILIDTDLPGVSGLEVSRVMRRGYPHMATVLLSASMESASVVKAIRAGVSAYLPRNVSWDILLQVLRDVRAGNYPINELVLAQPDVAAQVLADFRQMALDGDVQQVYSPLSPRELQVLELVANNQTNKEIASSLEISNQTVKNHVSSILRKLAVNDRTQAVIYAVRQGWIKAAIPRK